MACGGGARLFVCECMIVCAIRVVGQSVTIDWFMDSQAQGCPVLLSKLGVVLMGAIAMLLTSIAAQCWVLLTRCTSWVCSFNCCIDVAVDTNRCACDLVYAASVL